MFAVTLVLEVPQSDSIVPVANVATFGALVGLLVGLSDVRRPGATAIHRTAEPDQRHARVATEELVNQTDRKSLEQAVCGRLSESAAYESVWIGRYDEGRRRRPPDDVVRARRRLLRIDRRHRRRQFDRWRSRWPCDQGT